MLPARVVRQDTIPTAAGKVYSSIGQERHSFAFQQGTLYPRTAKGECCGKAAIAEHDPMAGHNARVWVMMQDHPDRACRTGLTG